MSAVRTLLPVLVAIVLAVPPVAAASRLVLGLGATTASSDGPQRSGMAASLAASWTLDSHLEIGPELFADDLGSRIGRLRDPNDGTDLGAFAEAHRYAFGGAWRADLPLDSFVGWQPRAIASWGYYRIQDDRVGVVQRALSTIGWSAGAGISHSINSTLGIGISARYHQLLDYRQNHYVRAAVDFVWGSLGTAGPRTPRKATP